MQIKHILAAAALVATGAANAAIDGGGTSGNGSLHLVAFDNQNGTTTSAIFDLGYTLQDFVGTGTGGNTVVGTLGAPNTTVVWNFLNNSVTVNGTLASIGTNSWTSAFNKLIANSDAGELQYVVGALDNTGTGTGKRALFTGSTTPTAQQLLDQNNANLGTILQVTNGGLRDIFSPLNGSNNGGVGLGTIVSADNGAFTYAAGDGATSRSAGYVVAGDAMANNWVNGAKLGATVDAGVENGLWLGDGGTAGAERLIGRVTFNAVAGTMTFTNVVATSNVPEPSTYALALMGLAVAGVAARRRRA